MSPLKCQVICHPLRTVTFVGTSVISVDFHDWRFKAEEVWFKWFWIIQYSSSDQFLTQLLQGIYLIRVSWIAISNLFACYSLIHLDFSIVLSITLKLNWSILGLCCDMTVCKLWNIIIYNSLGGPAFLSRNYVSGANWICFDDPFIYDWAFSELRQSLWSPSIAWLVTACFLISYFDMPAD